MPFTNVTGRKYASDIIALHFVREFSKGKHFTVVEPGLIKEKLLDYRIILYEGISLGDADLVAGELKADLVLTGKVLDYEDYAGVFSKPKVDFSILLIDRKTGEVVWSSRSHNEGDDTVFFFDRGRVNTAHVLAAEMAKAVERMLARK
jgi:TolB-like protein